MAASSISMAVDDLVEDLQLHEVILQSLDEHRPGAVEERQEIVDIVKELQTKLADIRGETLQKPQQNLSVRQSTPASSSPARSIGQVDGGYDASPFDNSGQQSPQPSLSQHEEGERHRGPFPVRKRRLSSASLNTQPPVKRPQANDPSRSNTQTKSSQGDDELDDGAEELRMLLGLDNDTMAVFQHEQMQAEEELKKRKEQEHRDAEFARVLHESVFDQPQPMSTAVPPQRGLEHNAYQHRDDHSTMFRAGLLDQPLQSLPIRNSSSDFSKSSIGSQMPGLPQNPFSMGASPGPNMMSSGASPFTTNVQLQAQDNRLKPHTMAQPLPKVPTRLANQEDFDDDIQEINRSEFQPSNRVYSSTYTPPAFARPGMMPMKRENGLNRPQGYDQTGSSSSLQSTMARLNAGRQMLQEARKSMWGGLPNLYDALNDDPMREVIQRGSGFTLDPASSDYMRQFEFTEGDPKKAKEEIKKLLETIRPDIEIAEQNREGTPEALRATLLEHQKVGLTWMKSMEESENRGGILADDMGLGKTIQAIALMVSRPSNSPERKPTLVVAPVALMQQWKREIERLLRPGKYQLSVFILHGENRKATFRDLKDYDVVLTTFGTLSSELKRKEKCEQLHKESGSSEPLPRTIVNTLPCLGPTSKWYRVIVDEAQCIKNRNTKSAMACCQIDATYRWCMSGTPMMNNVEELHSLIKFLRIRPYSSLERFNREFTGPLNKGTGSVYETAMKQLQVLLKAILLRRTKDSKIDGKSILQLPPRVSEKVHAVFDEDERQLYSALESKSQIQFNKYLDSGSIGRNYSDILVLLLRLRQACCHPHLMSDFSVKVDTDANANDIDLVANAKAFGDDIIARLRDHPNLECPICIDAVENPTIFFPCGHGTCAECFAKISDPSAALEQGVDGAAEVKCPNCRTKVDPKKITDHVTFKRVHYPDPFDKADETAENGLEKPKGKPESEDESDSEDSDGDLSKFIVKDHSHSKGKGKVRMGPKKSLAQLRKEGQRNQSAKRKYMRRLNKKWVSSAKIEKALEILQEVENRNDGQKTIIFSQFTSLLDLLEVPIARHGWGYRRYDGSMRPQDRNSAVQEFTDQPECKIMLVSLKAGNSGLNLIAASHVIIFDPFWNPYIEEQAIDRAHRIGQQREVHIHRILVEQTVEDRILELQDKKRELIEGALDENASKSISRLGPRELGYLFGVNV